MLRRQRVILSGLSSESCTGYTDNVVNGFLVGLQFTTNTTDAAATGKLGSTGAISITGERTGLTYYSNTTGGPIPGSLFPVCQLCSSSGGALGDTTAPLISFFPIAEERVKVATSGGTSSAAFSFNCFVLTQGA
jgi:hypothetical protein